MTMNSTTKTAIVKYLRQQPISEEEKKDIFNDIKEKTKKFDIDEWYDTMIDIGEECPELYEPYINWALANLGDMSLTIVEAVKLFDDVKNPFRDIWNSNLIETVPLSYALDCYRVVILSVLQATEMICITARS